MPHSLRASLNVVMTERQDYRESVAKADAARACLLAQPTTQPMPASRQPRRRRNYSAREALNIMPSPRIGSGRSFQEAANKKAAKAMVAEQTFDSIGATATERELGNVDAVLAAREAEKQTILATIAPAPSRPSLTDRLAKASSGGEKLVALGDAEHEGQRAAEQVDRARAEALIEPHRKAGHGAITRMGLLRQKHQERVARIAALDLRAVLKRVPPKVVPGLGYTPNHRAIDEYVRLARAVNDIMVRFKPVDFELALQAAQATVYHGSTSPEFVNEVKRHLPWHTKRLTNIVTGVEEKLRRLDELEAQIEADMAGLELLDVAPDPKPDLLPPMQPMPPRHDTSAFWDFDPRDESTLPQPPSGPEVTMVGAEGEGIRVGNLAATPRESDNPRTYGVAPEVN